MSVRSLLSAVLVTSAICLSVGAASAEVVRPKARPAALTTAVASPSAAPAAQVTEVASQALRPRARPASLARQAAREVATEQHATLSTRNAPVRLVVPNAKHLAGRMQVAVQNASAKRARGQRVWCVPFARDASGINIKGDAHTWWHKAAGQYQRSKQPAIGAVMSFQSVRGMSRGHVAVVSQVVNSRRVLLNHANWSRNQVSLNMVAVDVSPRNDWSQVRLEHRPGQMGTRTYPVNGFIHPNNV